MTERESERDTHAEIPLARVAAVCDKERERETERERDIHTTIGMRGTCLRQRESV